MNLRPLTEQHARVSSENASISLFKILMGKQGQPEESSGKEGKTRETASQLKQKFPKPVLYLDHETEIIIQ